MREESSNRERKIDLPIKEIIAEIHKSLKCMSNKNQEILNNMYGLIHAEVKKKETQ